MRKVSKKQVAQPSGVLKAASFSALQEFEKGCPRKVYYGRVERRPDPLGPAAQRGNVVHEKLYGHLTYDHEPPKESHKVAKELKKLKTGDYVLECEGDWAVNRAWEPVDWLAVDVYARCKTDVLALGKKTRTIDFKTGREYPYHVEQMELQGLFVLLRHPQVRKVNCELWYLDQGSIVTFELARRELEGLRDRFTQRFDRLLEEQRWPARPGQACRWCAFSQAKGGPCQY